MRSNSLLTCVALVAALAVSLPAHASDSLSLGNAGQTLFHDSGSGKYFNSVVCESSDGSSNVSQGATAANQATANANLALLTVGAPLAPIRLDTSSTNVTTSAYVQLIASTASAANQVRIYNGGTADLVFAVGASSSEVDKLPIAPSGWSGPYPISIATASRLSVKAKSGTQSSGVIIVSLIQ